MWKNLKPKTLKNWELWASQSSSTWIRVLALITLQPQHHLHESPQQQFDTQNWCLSFKQCVFLRQFWKCKSNAAQFHLSALKWRPKWLYCHLLKEQASSMTVSPTLETSNLELFLVGNNSVLLCRRAVVGWLEAGNCALPGALATWRKLPMLWRRSRMRIWRSKCSPRTLKFLLPFEVGETILFLLLWSNFWTLVEESRVFLYAWWKPCTGHGLGFRAQCASLN